VKQSIFFISLLILFNSCQQEDAPSETPIFELLQSERTGLDFINELTPTPDLNVFNYMYFYNGGGAAVADLNNDGQDDLFFTGNQKDNALFLNEGGLKFKKVTSETGIKANGGWSNGVSTVDINNDGLTDIYIAQVSDYRGLTGTNQLFVCDGINEEGIPTYSERAADYGLDFQGFSTQAAWFDYDLDGDLDMYLLNHSLHNNGTFGKRENFVDQSHPKSGDRLYRNDGNSFSDVTKEAGIMNSVIGYGLGIAVSDLNGDLLPDIYIGNDFHENDYLYINNGDGTFTESLNDMINHTSRFSMGVDIADFNNDGWKDIISLDMLPEKREILKSSLGEDGFSTYKFKLGFGYNHQFARNNLQLNNGDGSFSEIAPFAGVEASDWSWASLFLDFDNDGWKDLFISNGIPRRMNDIDYINFISNDDLQGRIEFDAMDKKDMDVLAKLPEIKIENKFFRNQSDLRFQDSRAAVVGDIPSYSNGTVYADLDGDGDLELVCNNVDSPDIHIGVGDKSAIDSIVVVWPDLGKEILSINLDKYEHTLAWKKGLRKSEGRKVSQSKFVDSAAEKGFVAIIKENSFADFDRETLIPHLVGSEGPCLTKGDVNGDQLDDLLISGSKRNSASLYLQRAGGSFELLPQPDFEANNVSEDVDAIFNDLDNDGDLDLVCASGGNEFSGKHVALLPKVYINDGSGNFAYSASAIQKVFLNASKVLPLDINADGFTDLIVTGRSVPRKYGRLPDSYLLVNDGNGKFSDQTKELAPDFKELGLITGGEMIEREVGKEKIILSSEWGHLKLLENQNGKIFVSNIGIEGLWNNIILGDFDSDGDEDFIATNAGLNSRLNASKDEPISLYVNDFDGNKKDESIMTYFLDKEEVPFASYAELTSTLPHLKKKYLKAKDFAGADLEDLVGGKNVAQAKKLKVSTLANCLFEQTAEGFKQQKLPNRLQFSSLRCGLFEDINNDGYKDLVLAGNFHGNNIEIGNYDADFGSIIYGEKDQNILEAPIERIGSRGEIRDMEILEIGGERHLFLARHNDTPLVYPLGQ